MSTLYLIIALTGLVLMGKFLKRDGHAQRTLRISIFWPVYTFVVWLIYAGIAYPDKLYDWIRNIVLALSGNPLHAYQSVGFGNFLSMPITDQISFVCYPLLILGLVAYGLLKPTKNETNDLATTTLGLNSLLIGLLVVGLVTSGITYPIRMIELMCILSSPLAANSLIELLSSTKKKRLIVAMAMIAIVCLNTHWLFRIIQRTVPSWISESWLD